MRKALQNKRGEIAAPASCFDDVPEDVANDCEGPTTEDIEGMLKAVFDRASHPKDDDEVEDDVKGVDGNMDKDEDNEERAEREQWRRQRQVKQGPG